MATPSCKPTKQFSRSLLFLSSIFLGLPIVPMTANAAPTVLNPCPRIYYEEPYNSRLPAPQTCPPNRATDLARQGLLQPRIARTVPQASQSQVRPIQPPLPETRSTPIATVIPQAGRVNVRLKNDTNIQVNYEAIGYTQPRSLSGGQEVVLRNLPTPVTLTVVRPDGGFVQFMPMPTSVPGTLEVSLKEAPKFNNTQGVLRIQPGGQVFLN